MNKEIARLPWAEFPVRAGLSFAGSCGRFDDPRSAATIGSDSMRPVSQLMVHQAQRLALRPVTLADAAETAALMAPSISQMLTTWPEVMTEAQAQARIEGSMAETVQGLWTDWAIRRRSSGELCGWIGLGRRATDQLRYTVGIWLGEAHQHQGIGGEAVETILAHARTIGAIAVEAEIDQCNEPSRRLFTKMGFRRIGERDNFSPVRGRAAPSWVYERVPV